MRHCQPCRAATGSGTAGSVPGRCPQCGGDWSHLDRGWAGEEHVELGALRWRGQTSGLLLISTGDMCLFWGG